MARRLECLLSNTAWQTPVCEPARASLEEPVPLHVDGGCAQDNAIPGALVSQDCMQRCQCAHALASHIYWRPCPAPQADMLGEG